MIGSENDIKLNTSEFEAQKYQITGLVLQSLRKGGGQNEIIEGAIAGSSFDIYTEPLSIHLAQEDSSYCWYFMGREVEAQTTVLLFVLFHWSLSTAHCLFPFPLLSMSLPVFPHGRLKTGSAQQ